MAHSGRGVRLQAHEPGEQRVEAGAVAGMQVDAADLLDQPLERLELLEPQEEGLSSISFAVLRSERVAAVSVGPPYEPQCWAPGKYLST
jgi:hypothetical protein